VEVRRAENWLSQRRTPAEQRLDRLAGFLAVSPPEARPEDRTQPRQ
jgi:hypothetical protein